MMQFKRVALHLLIFVVIEIVFIGIIFREWPSIDFFSVLGIGHLVYLLMLPLCGWIRIQSKRWTIKSLASSFPIVFHVLIHVVAIGTEVHHHCGHDHGDHNITSIMLMSSLFVTLVVVVEYVLHNKTQKTL